MDQWYVLYTEPRHEKKANQLLSSKGYTTYLPLQMVIKQWSDRKKKVEMPLFNSYLFIKTNHEKHNTDILSTPGIVKFVRIGKEIARMREEHIVNIKMLLSEFDELNVVSSDPLSLKQKVEIIGGPFMGMKGILTDFKGTKHFAIEIDALGSNIIVNVNSNLIRARE